MAITPLTVTIDLNPSYKKIPAVYVSQLDNNLRSLAITVQDGGVNYDVASSGYDVYVEGTKPDKHGFSYKVTDIGGTVVGSVVTVPMQTQMTCVQGMVPTEIVLKSGADRIGSANFLLVVERAGLAEDVDVSETDIPAYIDGAQQAAAAAAQSADDAEDAKDLAVSAAATAQDVLDSIPQDYTALSNKVISLESSKADYGVDTLVIGSNLTTNAGRVNGRTGAIEVNSAYAYVTIEVNEGDSLTFTPDKSAGIGYGFGWALYDANDTYVSGVVNYDLGDTLQTITIPEGIAYFRLGGRATNMVQEPWNTFIHKRTLHTLYGAEQDIEELQTTIANGNYPNNSIPLLAIEGITNIYSYKAKTLKNKTIGVSGGTVQILDGTDKVYLFEKGLGFVANDTTLLMIVNKATLARVTHKNANVVYNLHDLADDQYLAVCKTGLHTLDFDYVTSNQFPNTEKDITKVPKTNFSTYNYNSGVTSYNGSTKLFAPFKYNGTLRTINCQGYTLYNDDGTVYQGASIAYNAVTVPNKIVVIGSNDIENASIYPLSSPYQYSGKLCSVFGDSLTADAPYYPYLAELTGLQIKNCGIGGTRVSGTAANAMHQDVRINALEGDFIVIMGGSNDAGSATVGTLDLTNHDTDTFVGAYNVMLSKIYYRYGISARYYSDVDYTGVTQLESVALPNIILVTPPKVFTSQTNYNNIESYCDYVKQIAKWWGLPVVDAFSNMQMSWISKDYYFASTDYTHYNTHGRSKLGALIASKFAECYSNIDSQI